MNKFYTHLFSAKNPDEAELDEALQNVVSHTCELCESV